MGASIMWRPVNPKQFESCASGSRFHQALEKAFGSLPVVLSNKDIPKLEGMVAAGMEDLGELIHAIYDHETIEVSVQY